MSQRAATQMSVDEFLEWGLHQEPRHHQLVDGIAIAPGWCTKQQHDQIVANTHGILYNLMRGKAMRGKKWRYFYGRSRGAHSGREYPLVPTPALTAAYTTVKR